MLLTRTETGKLAEVQIILSTELFRKISIAELRMRSELSYTQLTQGFKQLYGVTIANFHLQRRMEHARGLIEQGFQMQEVSSKLGYSEPSAFTRAFKRIYPNSPIRYKEGE